jgi:hypothetical protein
MFLLNNQPLQIDTAFSHNGVNYPQNWLRLATPQDRAAIGITEAAEPAWYDDRFYWGVDNPKDLDGLKTQWTDQVKDTASKLLAATDWMVIRKVERNIDIPAETVTYRAAVLVECDRLTTAIAAASNVEDLITAVSNQSWQ